MATQIGFIKAIIGEVTATSADGGVRTLQAGDRIFANDLISTGPGGAVEIEFNDGSVMDLGRDSQALLDNSVFNPDAAATAELGEEAVPDDIAAIQQALLEGEDPTQVGEATAAGAGVEGGNEGHEPVFVDYLNPAVIPDAGFDTVGVMNEYDLPEEDIIILEEEEEEAPLPTVGVAVEVEIEIDPENPPPDNGIPNEDYPLLVDGNGAIVLEGTNGGEPREVTFLLKLSEISTQDVEVTYQLRPLTADHPDDWFNGALIQTVTIPAGTQTIPVTVMIVQDHLDEGNEQFDIVLLSATNATINPDADTAIVTIYDDDTTPVAQDDFNSVAEDEDDGTPVTQGNVISGANDAGNDPLAQEDTDEDGDVLQIVSFSDANETVGPDGMVTGDYGTLTMDINGNYTYTLTSNDDPVIQGLAEGETLTDVFTYIVTDTYNQPQTATLTITIVGTNDGPGLVVTNGATGTVYEAGLPDGSMVGLTNTTVTGDFTISDPDGLDDITHVNIDGTEIAIADLGNNNEINTGHSKLVITSYNAMTGVATFEYTLLANVTDVDMVDEQDIFELSVSDDGGVSYSTPDNITITIVDDVPVFTIVNDGDDADNIVSLTALNATTLHEDVQLADWVYGADGLANATITIPDGVNAEVVSQDEETIVLNFFEGEGDDKTLVATMTLNADGTDSVQTYFREFETEVIPLLTSSVTASGPDLQKFIITPQLEVTITASDGDNIPGEAADEVNPSTQGWAVDDNQVDENESITFTFDRSVNNFSFAATGFTGNPSGGTVGLNITVFYNEAKTDFETFFIDVAEGETVNVDQLPGFGSNVDASTTIWAVMVESDGDSQDGNDGFRLNNVSVTTTSSTPPDDLAYEGISIEFEDGDGDTTSQTFNFYLNGEEGTELMVETVAGTSADDSLMGDAGDNFLIGGRGDDELFGGAGADIFDFNEADMGTADAPYQDDITDFNEGEGDVIDLADVLSNPDNQIAGVENDGHLQIQISNSEGVIQTIDVMTIAVANDAAAQIALNDLLTSGGVDDGV